MAGDLHAPTGHVFRVERARGPVWYAKYRLPDGRQIQTKIGPAWIGRRRPAAGHVTKRLAEDRLRELLEEARRGTLPGLVRTGATFADAAAEWLRYIEHDRMRKPSTVAAYRSLLGSQILPTFGDQALEAITPAMIETWIAGVDRTAATRVKLRAMVHGIFQRARKVWGLKLNPAVDVEKPPLAAPATSRSSRPRRCGRWSGPPHPSRTGRSFSRPRSPVCAAAS